MPGLMLEQLLDKHAGIADKREYAEVVAMEYAASFKKPKWIRSDLDLPEIGQKVDLWEKGKGRHADMKLAKMVNRNFKHLSFVHEEYWHLSFSPDDDIYWIPLPDAPEDERT